jgi:hypothetical protein
LNFVKSLKVLTNYPNSCPPAQKTMTFEEKLLYRQQRAEYVKESLKRHFPVKYVLAHAIFIGQIGLACIGIQIELLVKEAYNAKVCQGIWAGLVGVLAAAQALYLRESCSFFFYSHTRRTVILFVRFVSSEITTKQPV